jgi:demethylmenaquinone methyltransferase / 2-methoxy-6-polyprenyl-1,4-benzoquinol methylase
MSFRGINRDSRGEGGQVAKQDRVIHSKPLYGMFTDIPRHYDLINHLITWNMDKIWRRKAALECLSTRPPRILDLCCGTGDLAITIAALADYAVEIKGLDYSQPMLDIAARKVSERAELLSGKTLAFYPGEAARQPFPDGSFDCIGISFAFRNLTYNNPLASNHLAEILRVLKPGGRLVIAESSQPRSTLVRSLYHFYMRQYVYRIGSLISGNRPAYRYLAESSVRYYSPQALEELLLKSGFRSVSYRPLFFGAAGIYSVNK